MTVSLIDGVRTMFPGAGPVVPTDTDSAIIAWGHCHIVITPSDTPWGDTFDVGIYDVGMFEHGMDPLAFVAFPRDVAGIVAMLEDLTEIGHDNTSKGPANNTQWAHAAADEIRRHPDRLDPRSGLVRSHDSHHRRILTVGQLRSMIAMLPAETHVVMADKDWYVNIGDTGIPNDDQDPWSAVTFFAGSPFDSRQF